MNEKRLGELLLQRHIITADQLLIALQAQQDKPDRPLGQTLCQLGYIKEEVLAELLDTLDKRPPLGRILLRRKLLTTDQVDTALTTSRKNRTSFGATLLALQLISETQLAEALAEQYDLPFVSLAKQPLQPGLARLINASYARKNRLVPIAADDTFVTIALAFPTKRQELKQIEACTNLQVKFVVARESEIIQIHHRLYNPVSIVKAADREALNFEISEDANREQAKSRYLSEYISADVDFLVRKLLALGIRHQASDIHFESTEQGMLIRFRIDGMLQTLDLGEDAPQINTNARQIVSKIKILCDMDIAERRRPQDSSFKMQVKKGEDARSVDFRVSTVPTQFGEDVVIRVLDKRGGAFTMESLGYYPAHIDQLCAAMEKPTGLFLVTGPTGSGKSSTLYAILGRLNTPNTKTLTVEDPIEYSIEGITQTEVNEVIGNTFPKMLRAFLRQDPDNIMVGEIRDAETAMIAIRAAMTGHTVLSTLHTNDATSAVTRLLDMGVEANLLATTLRCVLAQRLVRRVCDQCRRAYAPPAELLKTFSLPDDLKTTFYQGTGCPRCNYTGYCGRRPVVELWLPTREELSMLNHKPDNLALRREAFSAGKRPTLIEDGLQRVFSGETTLEELLRVVPYEQIENCQENIASMLRHQVNPPLPLSDYLQTLRQDYPAPGPRNFPLS